MPSTRRKSLLKSTADPQRLSLNPILFLEKLFFSISFLLYPTFFAFLAHVLLLLTLKIHDKYWFFFWDKISFKIASLTEVHCKEFYGKFLQQNHCNRNAPVAFPRRKLYSAYFYLILFLSFFLLMNDLTWQQSI